MIGLLTADPQLQRDNPGLAALGTVQAGPVIEDAQCVGALEVLPLDEAARPDLADAFDEGLFDLVAQGEIEEAGEMLWSSGELDAAAEHYERAMDDEDYLPVASFNLGTVREDQGARTDAIALYRVAADGGASWKKMGLDKSEHIGMIAVDPRDSNVVYVAAQGPLWSAGGERGLFKTVDGGQSWENVLSGGPFTGVNEVVMDPRNPDVMYAVTWQRFRNVAVLLDGGPATGIHKSEDGGETWRELTQGLPEENMAKTGLAVSPQNPDVIYATIELANRTGAMHRSEDGGETWVKGADYTAGGTGPHYYNELWASPHQFDRVYHADVQMHVTEDGGKTMRKLDHDTKHSDHHALAFDPDDENYLLVGVDGPSTADEGVPPAFLGLFGPS